MKKMWEFGLMFAVQTPKSSQMDVLFSVNLLLQCKDKRGFIFIIHHLSTYPDTYNECKTRFFFNYVSHFLFALLQIELKASSSQMTHSLSQTWNWTRPLAAGQRETEGNVSATCMQTLHQCGSVFLQTGNTDSKDTCVVTQRGRREWLSVNQTTLLIYGLWNGLWRF